ncbi:hypothetical protein PUATCC27989T_00506 [Phytobacter ursingii]|nr:hypothetical protein PUATCC27989T_00506 [Phytobacter ursingii]
MEVLYLYCSMAVAFGVIELIGVMSIKDGAPLWLKVFYGFLSALLWPLLAVVLFIPERVLKKFRSTFDG